MMNRTELDVRFMNHAARVAYADQFGALHPTPSRTQRSPRRFAAALLLRLATRLAPEHAQQAGASDAAIA